MYRTIAVLTALFIAVPTLSQQITPLGNHFLARVVYVPATSEFVDAGFDLLAGDTVEIHVRGVVSHVSDLSQVTWWGPAGRGVAGSEYPLPGQAAFSCIGRIGATGALFYVGEVLVFAVNTTGRLYLGVNDFLVGDNLGGFVAYVYKRPLPFTGVLDDDRVPGSFTLQQNYPNPFNPSTTIAFEIPHRGEVRVLIYNPLGQLVRSLIDAEMEPGTHTTVWDGRNNEGSPVTSGSYFYQVELGNSLQVKKMILVK